MGLESVRRRTYQTTNIMRDPTNTMRDQSNEKREERDKRRESVVVVAAR